MSEPRSKPERDYLALSIDIAKSIIIPISVALSAYYVQKALLQQQIAVQQEIAVRQDTSARLALAVSIMNNAKSDNRLKNWAIYEIANTTEIRLNDSVTTAAIARAGQVARSMSEEFSANEASKSDGCIDLNSCMKLYFDELHKTELSNKGKPVLETDRINTQRYALPTK